MSEDEDVVGQMFAAWREGQEAYFKAQNEMFDAFNSNAWSTEPFHPELFPNWFKSDDQDLKHFLEKPFSDFLDHIIGGVRFADLPQPQMEVAAALKESMDYQNGCLDMTKLVHDAYGRAYDVYVQQYTLEDLQSGDVKEALDAWLSAVNSELLKTQKSQEFLDAQKNLISAGTKIKARQKNMAEAWSNTYQIPTRTEVDDMAKSIYDLRKEMRSLKCELAELKGSKKR